MTIGPTAVFIEFDSLKAADQAGIEFVRNVREAGRVAIAIKVDGKTIDQSDLAVFNKCAQQGAPLAGIFTDLNELRRRFPAVTMVEVVEIAPLITPAAT